MSKCAETKTGDGSVPSPRLIEDSAEIWNQLRKDMNQTIEFIEGCNDEELSLLAGEIGDIITEFNETGEGEFVDFLREIAESRGITDLLEEIDAVVQIIKTEPSS